MKKLFLILTFCILAASCNSNKFTVEGNIENLSGLVVFQIEDGVRDSVMSENGRFTFSGSVEKPEFGVITAEGRNIIVFVENTRIRITGNMDDPGEIHVQGGKLNQTYRKYTDEINRLDDEITSGNASEERIAEIYNEIDAKSKEYTRENRDNILGAYLLVSGSIFSMTGEEIDEHLSALPENMNGHPFVTFASDMSTAYKKTAVGEPAPFISLPGTDGDIITLESLLNKDQYILIDFWASWCGPCIAEVPHLTRAHADFRERGFEIYGVSLDNNRDAWSKAIQHYGLDWPNVSSLQGWGCPVVAAYGIRSIPANLLLNPEGIIVAKNLRGKALEEKLADIYR